MSRLVIRYVSRAVHRAFVNEHHSHHRATVGETLALGGFVDEVLHGVAVMGRPTFDLDDGATWEVTRLCVKKDALPHAASRLLGGGGSRDG